ncbi:MAG: hypothetical protein KDI51_03485 [Xanthomonadales bacterium]|nr:hypothetical protein [Xanthomonadales bacterium]
MYLHDPVAWELRLLLLQQLETQLPAAFVNAALEAKLDGWAIEIPKQLHLPYASVDVARRPDSALKLGLAFERANCTDCYFGVSRRTSMDVCPRTLNEPLDAQFGIGQVSEWWGWWRSFEPRFWWNDRHTWVAILDGSLAREVADWLVGLIRAVSTEEHRPLFDQVTRGLVAAAPDRDGINASQVALEIHRRQDAKLIAHLFAVESANGRLRRALAYRTAASVRALVEAQGTAVWIESKERDLTGIYSGFAFRLRDRSEFSIRVEFQSGGCRNAIYGLQCEGVDGTAEQAEAVRQRLDAVALATGKCSAGWLWYRALETPNWFDQPEVAAAAYAGELAGQIAKSVLGLADALKLAGLLSETSPA